jgi:exodeoxyribonuclease VII large subunit
VARAISASHKPIVSAVGHETDTTIADYVADVRAATPSVAGELVVPVKADLVFSIDRQKKRLIRSLKMSLELARKNYRQLESCRFLRKPSLLVAERRIFIMNLSKDLESLFKRFVSVARHRFELLKSGLTNLNPKALLSRGFIMAQDADGKVITSVSQLKVKQALNITFADGYADVSVKKVNKSDGADNDK